MLHFLVLGGLDSTTVNQLLTYRPTSLPPPGADLKVAGFAERLERREVERLGHPGNGRTQDGVEERSSENWGIMERGWLRANCWGRGRRRK